MTTELLERSTKLVAPCLAIDSVWDTLLTPGLAELVDEHLATQAIAIDLEGLYPEDFLRELAVVGGYAGIVAAEYGGNGLGLAGVIAAMARVSQACLSTAFTVWCQTACARYIQLSSNAAAQGEWLEALTSGWQLGGSGLSNTLKSHGEMETYLLSARRAQGGYVVDGSLPWVSNLGPDHIFVTGCPVQDGRLVFFVVDCRQDGFELVDGGHFSALEGTRTMACQFQGVFIDDTRVLAHPDESASYLQRIKPGMILGQMGMPLGLVRDCICLIEDMDRTHADVNQYLDDDAPALRAELTELDQQTLALAREVDELATSDALPSRDLLRRVLAARLTGSTLSLRAAQSAVLHQGARGYLRHAQAQRRQREAAFVAIVTPSIRHLRCELARLNALAR